MASQTRKPLRTVVWTHGSPPYALLYRDGNQAVPVELQSFRPDPTRVLTARGPKTKHAATVAFVRKPHGLQAVKSVTLSQETYVRVR